MIYVLDASALRVMKNYYPGTFQSFWENLGELVAAGRVTSTLQVMKEILAQSVSSFISDWVGSHEAIFTVPTTREMAFVREIFKVPHFRGLVEKKSLLTGGPAADAWVIARAQALDGGCVVSQELPKPHSSKIPTVCAAFSIPCCTVEEWMKAEGWVF